MVTCDLKSLIGNGDALIIIPPFAGINRPSLGVHLLQASAEVSGFRVKVFYANLALAQVIGETNYEAINQLPTGVLLGERFFSAAAYGLPPLGRNASIIEEALSTCNISDKVDLSPQTLHALETRIHDWVEMIAKEIAQCDFPVFGCSTTFEQTSASIAILNRIKIASPNKIVILGGANAENECRLCV